MRATKTLRFGDLLMMERNGPSQQSGPMESPTKPILVGTQFFSGKITIKRSICFIKLDLTLENGGEWLKPQKTTERLGPKHKNKPKQLSNGTVVSPSSEEFTETRWVAHVEIADKKMKTWKKYPINHESTLNVIQPSILLHPNNKLQVLCRSREGSVISSWSTDNGKTWSDLEKTNLINPNSGTDAIAVKNQFWIVYNPDIPGKDWWEGRAKLNIAFSNNGLDWNKFLELENHDKGEFSYPTIFQDSKGKIHITYTYNRVNVKHVVLDPK